MKQTDIYVKKYTQKKQFNYLNSNKWRIVFSYVLLLFALGISAQINPIAEIWTQPAFFKPDEKVAFYFDLTGTALEGTTEDVYMWTWYPTEPDAGNWNNSSDFAKLTHVEGNIWKFEIVPTEYYGVPADQIKEFYGLLKNKNGTKQTDAFAPDKGNTIYVPGMATIAGTARIDYFPKNFKSNRPLSILVNTNNTWSGCESGNAKQGDLANADNVHIHSGINGWSIVVENNPANDAKTAMTHLGNGIYRIDFIPEDYYNCKGTTIKSIHAVFANLSWSLMGKDVNCADFYIKAPDAPEVLPPVFTVFPQKFSKRDIIYLSRVNNEDNVTMLSYEITASGASTLKGDFTGTKAKFEAYIDLASWLKNVSTVSKIHLTVKTNSGKVVVDTDINLVSLK